MSYSEYSSGNSRTLWLDAINLTSQYPSLNKDVEIEVCIVGGGIAGLSTAYQLLLKGNKVIVLEDGLIGSGETGRTSAHLSSALDDHYKNIKDIHGSEGARLAAESHMKALDTIENIVKNENIDCDFLRVPAYLFAHPIKNTKFLELEQKYAEEAGLKGVELIQVNQLKPNTLGPYLIYPNQAQFHPMKYLKGLAQAIVRLGGKIYEHTHAKEVKVKDNNTIKIRTQEGFEISAKHCVMATNSPNYAQNLLFAKLIPNRSYVITAIIPKDSYEKALYWDMSDPYHYVRIQPGEKEDKLIIGGEDHRTGECEKEVTAPFKRLEEWARKFFPLIKEVTHKWSGQILEPIDYLAFIGRRKKDENVYVITGDSGDGLTHGVVGSLLISDLINEIPNDWEGLYSPTRTILNPLRDLVSNNAKVLMHYSELASFGKFKDPNDLAPDEAAIIQEGLHKSAYYKDKEGKLFKCKALCSHMKGLLKWNALEKSWDCPLHGSRFSPRGEVLNGPANENMIASLISVII
ncbi:MAG: FAD-dependent oxidoreductase [Francisellaceae bacterium]|nr:FAD-dependent oxidoreductase [Francisellaceae bacterium]